MSEQLLIGRKLQTLTPAEIEDLLCRVCSIPKNTLQKETGEYWPQPEGQESMHPDFAAWDFESEIRGETGGMSGGESSEWSSDPWEIGAGYVTGGWGVSMEPIAVVKWFLDHGWQWRETTAPAGKGAA